MIEIIMSVVFGGTIGLASGINSTDEPFYIRMGGVILGVIITFPIQMAINILI